MESFSIACTTCQVRLRVRDSAAIGQILTCPKCGSMVLVEPPHEDAPQDGTELVDAPSSPPTDPPRPPARPQEPTGELPPQQDSAAADTVEDLSLYGPPRATADSDAPQPPDADPVSSAGVDGPLLPTEDWTSAGARRWRNSALVAISAVVGILLALGLFAFVSSKLSGTSQAARPQSQSQALPQQRDSQESTTTQNEPTQAASVASADTEPPAAAPSDEQSEPQPEEAETNRVPQTPADAQTTASADLQEPLAADETVPPGFVSQDAVADSESLNRAVNQFESMLDDSLSSPPADEVVLEAPVDEPKTGVLPDEPALPRPEPREIDVTARLGDSVPGIEFKEAPLIDFLQFMSQYSTIPISLHPESLIWLQLTPTSPVSVDKKNSTVGEVLRDALKPLGLGFTILDDQLLVSRPSTTPTGSLRPFPFDIADLSADRPAADELAAMTVHLVAPDSWEVNGGAGKIAVESSTLQVQQHDEILFEVLFLLEKLRVARGVSPRSNFDPRVFQIAGRNAKARPRLEHRVSLNYIRPTSFTAIVDRLGAATGTHLLIDWRALATYGWTLDSQRTLQVHDQPLSEALTTLLVPMELTYRVVDETVLEITTPVRFASIIELEFYPLTALQADRWDSETLGRLQAAIPPALAGRARLRLDAVSQYLLVAAPQPAHEAIAAALLHWGESD